MKQVSGAFLVHSLRLPGSTPSSPSVLEPQCAGPMSVACAAVGSPDACPLDTADENNDFGVPRNGCRHGRVRIHASSISGALPATTLLVFKRTAVIGEPGCWSRPVRALGLAAF